MNRNVFICILLMLLVYFTLSFCEENIKNTLDQIKNNTETTAQRSNSKELIEEARRRKNGFHGLHHYWGWHALAIAYFIKVKLVIVAFFVGSAFFWGLRYFWPHKCGTEIVRETPIVYDHHSSSHYDHIPYSFDHSSGPYLDHSYESSAPYDSISNDPYSGYSDAPPSDVHRRKRNTSKREKRQLYNNNVSKMSMEEQIAEFMFRFLGLDTPACRRRFICEMEFRSKLNPLTSMAFRIVGRGFFERYTNARNTNGQATSFLECAAVNSECTVIQEDFLDQEGEIMEEHDTNNNNNNIDSNEIKESPDTDLDVKVKNMNKLNAMNLRLQKRSDLLQLKYQRRGRTEQLTLKGKP